MAVAFLLFFCRFAFVFAAFCLFLAVPMVRFSTLFSPFWCFCLWKWVLGGGLGGGPGGRNNVLSHAFYLTPLF